MTLRLRTVFFILLGLLVFWFLYIERDILSPFILGAVFAYIFNPIISFFSHKIRLPRVISTVVVYAIIISMLATVSVVLTKQIVVESSDLKSYINGIIEITRTEVKTLPDWLTPGANEALSALKKSRLFSPQSLFLLFPEAISRIVSFVIFLFSGFYFLKEGRGMFDKILLAIPSNYRIEVEILIRRINGVLNAYLRGQIFLVFLVSLVLFIALSIMGIRFALILAVFSGFAEIVPFIGPIVASLAAVIVVFLTGSNNFSLTPMVAAGVVLLIYFVVRQFQDYFINPYIMGKITKLHPLVILFSVLAGEHIGGILGVLLAVPVAGVIRILLEYSMDKINAQDEEIASTEKLS